MEDNERIRLRHKVVMQGRAELDRSIRNGNYSEWLKEEYGITDIDDIVLDKEFLEETKRKIEEARERKLVYDKDYKRYYLDEWIRKRDRKLILRKIFCKQRSKEEVKVSE